MTADATRRAKPMRSAENVLTDGIVRLAPFELEDATTVMQWDADREVQRWFDWPLTPEAEDPTTYAARLASAERTVRSKWEAWGSGDEFAFIIHAAATGDGLGWLDLQPRGSGRGIVAYGILPHARTHGVATRSVLLAAAYAFDVIGWVRLEIRTHADNVASRRVAEKAGFRLDGIMRSYGAIERHDPLIGQRFDEAVYSLLIRDR